MGCRGKWKERERARELRSQAWPLEEIATELGVSKSSASIWTRDVEFERTLPTRRRRSQAGRYTPGSIPGWRNRQRDGLLIQRLRVRVPPPERK